MLLARFRLWQDADTRNPIGGPIKPRFFASISTFVGVAPDFQGANTSGFSAVSGLPGLRRTLNPAAGSVVE
jgi:hypothetical protein